MSLRDTHHAYSRGYDEENGKTIGADQCPECEGELRTDGGEVTCTDCGLLVGEYWLDHSATPFHDDTSVEQTKRTGQPITPTRHDRGLSTKIGYKRDGNGHRLSSKTRRRFSRLRRHHGRAQWGSKRERNLGEACMEIARLVGTLDLPFSVREQASMLYRRAMAEDLIVGRSVEGVATACVYATCRCNGHPRTIGEFVRVARVDQSAIENGYRTLNRELGLETMVMRPQAFLPQLLSSLDVEVPPDTRHRAGELIESAVEYGIANGRKPSAVAAACLYLAGRDCGPWMTQTDIADVADTSPVTIRSRVEELEEVVGERLVRVSSNQ